MAKWTIADIPSQKGRLAVVTGANSGIGWHTALELARAGGEVMVTARTDAKGRDAVERIPKRQTTVVVFEMHFGTNYLGHFSLTVRLLPALLRSPSPRVTTVSSGAAN